MARHFYDSSLGVEASVEEILKELEELWLTHMRLARSDLKAFTHDEVSLDMLIDGLGIFRRDLDVALGRLRKLRSLPWVR